MKHTKLSYITTLLLALTLSLAMFFPILGQTRDQLPPYAQQFGSSLSKPIVKSKEKRRPDPLPEEDPDTFRVDTDLVINDILVFDKKGRQVTGLTQTDFTLTEDATAQDIAVFSHNDAEIPRSIVLVIDYSFSQLPYITTSIDAAKVLVDKLNPNDRMSVVTDDIKLIVEPTSDKARLRSGLESLKTAALSGKVGQSRQYSALMAVLNELVDKDGTRPIIILQTDGDELGTLLCGQMCRGSRPGEIGFSYDDMLKAAEREGATIFTVFSGVSFMGISEREKLVRAQEAIDDDARAYAFLQGKPVPDRSKANRRYQRQIAKNRLSDETAVARIADLTHGLASTLESPHQAPTIYDRILSDINSRYVLGYYPTNQSRDGKRRKLKIKVRNHPDYTIWSRSSYIAPLN